MIETELYSAATTVVDKARCIVAKHERGNDLDVVHVSASRATKPHNPWFTPVAELLREKCFETLGKNTVEDEMMWYGQRHDWIIQRFDRCPDSDHWCRHESFDLGVALGMG